MEHNEIEAALRLRISDLEREAGTWQLLAQTKMTEMIQQAALKAIANAEVERLMAEVEFLRKQYSKAVGQFRPMRIENENLKAEVERLRKENGWQPIETAPKDGTWFIAGFDGDMPDRHAWAAMCLWECGRFEVQETPDQPDYWMPLPKPHKEDSSQ